ncbi:tetratricopeptide repeat protein 9C [Genypterus blacodes]|uniref:tetratricopeptide repeat protein 9C n=1 Tax=Genypterus blacodes TaxID=154954 RepID=UPI003F768E99
METKGRQKRKSLEVEAATEPEPEPSFSGFHQPKLTPAKLDAQLQEATRMKTEGNTFYKEKKIRSAIGRYHHALLMLRTMDSEVTSSLRGLGPDLPTLSPTQETLLRNTQVDCYNNLAACLLQKKSVSYARVREYSLRVLQWRPGDVKALYRAGVATLELGDAKTAKQYLTQACREQPNDTNVRRHLQKAEEKLSYELQKEKAMYRDMFSSSLKSSSGD